MVKNIALAFLSIILLSGCSTNTRYVEGTSTTIGLYLPYDGQIMGVQLVSYLNGVKVNCPSNHTLEINRQYASSNTYFGVIYTTEQSNTKVKTTR